MMTYGVPDDASCSSRGLHAKNVVHQLRCWRDPRAEQIRLHVEDRTRAPALVATIPRPAFLGGAPDRDETHAPVS